MNAHAILHVLESLESLRRGMPVFRDGVGLNVILCRFPVKIACGQANVAGGLVLSGGKAANSGGDDEIKNQ